MSDDSGGSGLRAAALAAGGYLSLLLLSFLPLSLRPADTIAYVGDSLESVYIVAWNVHQVFRDPLHLFDANALHPNPAALTLTDHRLLPSLLVAPVVWLSGNAVLACNVAVAIASLLAAFGARRLALLLGVGPLAAWSAGALYAFHTYQINEAPRLNIVFHGFLPLALGELLLYLRHGRRARAASTAALMLLQGLSSNYHLLYGSLLVALVLAGVGVVRPRLLLARLPALAAATALAALAFAPIAWPYLESARRHGYQRELPAGIELLHYFSTSPTNLLYGPIGTEVRLQQRGPHFAGFAALGLAAFALARLRRPSAEASGVPPVPPRIWVPGAAALGLLLVLLSLGGEVAAFGRPLFPGPYRLLHAWVPGFSLVRIPERLALLAMLFLALLAARGVDLLRERWPRLALLLALLVPLEHVSPLPVHETVPVASGLPAVHQWLAGVPVSALAELPVRSEAQVRRETLEMYFSTAHFAPIIAGYTAYPPLLTRLLRRSAASVPAAPELAVLRRVGVDTLVVHQGRPLAMDLYHQLQIEDEAERRAAHETALRAAGLDLYAQLPGAVADGRLERVARFTGPAARLYESSADEVYRLRAVPRLAPAPRPLGARLEASGWSARTKRGDPAPALDGRLDTAWVVPGPLLGDEFFELRFPAPLPVGGLVLQLDRDSQFPTRFRVGARDLAGRWREVARFDAAHTLQLVEQLLAGASRPELGFELGRLELTGLSLLVEAGGTSHDGWRVSEIEVRAPMPGAGS